MKKLLVISCILLLTHLGWGQKIIEREIIDWEFRMVGDSIWKKAKVPGTIIDNFADLSDLSNPQHPYHGDNEKLYQWIGEKDWEFRTIVHIDPRYMGLKYMLTFPSLDLFANVYINNQPIHYHDTLSSLNAFVALEIPGNLEWHSPGDGTLTTDMEIRVVFYSTKKTLQDIAANSSLELPGGERIYGRTAQYQFGWDWGPTFINMGMRKPVHLSIYPQKYSELTLTCNDVRIEKNNALLNLNFNHHNLDGPYKVQHELLLNGELVITNDFILNFNKEDPLKSIPYKIENPALWWPNGIGDQNIYSFKFTLTKSDDTNGMVHQCILDYAFVTTELIQDKDKNGQSFYFKVNGKKVFAKGANYIPDDSFNPGINGKELINLAKDANMNMLRVWGGGTYPDNDFYAECLKNGIMIWQDYMFACAMYPINEEFAINARIEADEQYKKLSKYNNIVVWCGNNENDEGWQNWGWQKEFNYSENDSAAIWNGNLKLFESLPPNDGRYYRAPNYIASSPKHGWGRKESMTHGDSHYWGVWWGLEPIEKYKEKVPRFMSEYGMQAMPDLSLLQKIIPDTAMRFESPLFKNHQKHPTGFETINHYLKEYFSIPLTMANYIYATQILQAYSLQVAIESHRTSMPYCMGSLIWQLNDCWPVTSWSIIDYDLNKKISYSTVQKAFMPVIITMQETLTDYEFYIVNDHLKPHADVLNLYVSDFSGNIKWNRNLRVKVKQQSSQKVFKFNKNKLASYDLAGIYIHAELESDIHTQRNFHLVKPNELKLLNPEIKLDRNEKGQYFIQSDTYCPYIWLPSYNGHSGSYLPDLEAQKPQIILNVPEDGDWLAYLKQHPEHILCLNKIIVNR